MYIKYEHTHIPTVAIIGFNINLLKFNSNFIALLNTIKLNKNATKLFITEAMAAPFTPNLILMLHL